MAFATIITTIVAVAGIQEIAVGAIIATLIVMHVRVWIRSTNLGTTVLGRRAKILNGKETHIVMMGTTTVAVTGISETVVVPTTSITTVTHARA